MSKLAWLPDLDRNEHPRSNSWTDTTDPKGCLHTTEGGSWPVYDGWTIMPHATIMPIPGKGIRGRQHLPFTQGSFSLRNLAGGVQTNRDYVFQFELIGTSERGGPGLYWPDADEHVLADLYRKVIKPLSDAYGIPIRCQPWQAYPASYGARGITNTVRMSGSSFDNWSGWLGHQHVPENCVHPDTQILRADMRWVRAGDLQVGDELVGFDEETQKVGNANGGRRYRRSTVTRAVPAAKDSYRVTTTQGTVTASSDHPWLVRLPYVNRGSRVAWVASKDLDPAKHRIISMGEPWQAEDTRIGGWLAGVLDADGHAFAGGRHGSWVGFGQVDGAVLDLFIAECDRRGWVTKVIRRDYTKRNGNVLGTKDFTDVRINGGMWPTLRVLGTLRPERLLPAAERMWEGSVVGKTTGDVAVLRTEHVGEQPIMSLSTSTHTYVAEGLLCHNTHGDPGAFPWSRMLAAVAPKPPKPPKPTPPPTTPEEPMDQTDLDAALKLKVTLGSQAQVDAYNSLETDPTKWKKVGDTFTLASWVLWGAAGQNRDVAEGRAAATAQAAANAAILARLTALSDAVAAIAANSPDAITAAFTDGLTRFDTELDEKLAALDVHITVTDDDAPTPQ